jgi:hypothetical protein
MKTIHLLFISLIALISGPVAATSDGVIGVDEAGQAAQYLSIDVERVVVDITGLEASATTLAGSVGRLADAIGQLSTGDADLTGEQKQSLLAAVKSVDQAAAALTELARQLPGSADQLGERLPQILEAAQQPLAEIGSGLEYARDSIYTITESLPQATDNARQLVNATLDSAVLRLSIYTGILVTLLALALIGIMWFIYSQYLAPLARKLDELVGAPEHFDNMSRNMKETADVLLALQQAGRSGKQRGAGRYRRE